MTEQGIAAEAHSGPRAENWTAPYTSFTTMLRTIERMADQGGAPARIDRSYLANLPGGAQTIFLSSCKALGLIANDGLPTAVLDRLVEASPDQRKGLVGDLVREHYADALALGERATQQQLEEVFRTKNVTGSTLRKAVGFFINAAKFSGIKLSPNFKLPKATPSNGARKRPVRGSENAEKADATADAGNAPDSSPSSGLPTLMQGLIERLPADGETWSAAEAEQWLAIARLTLPFVYQFSFPDVKGG